MKNGIILFEDENMSKNEEVVENLIYEVRGKQVMLDSDLARFYECTNESKNY